MFIKPSSKKSKKPVHRDPPRRWHYTTEAHLPKILRSGVLLPATCGVDNGERPAVWTSANPVWEETANKGYVDEATGMTRTGTKATTAARGGLARIEVRPEAAPYDWVAFRAESGIHPRIARGLAEAAVAAGANPYEWFVSFEPIEMDDWLDIEVWRDGRWVTFARRTADTDHPQQAEVAPKSTTMLRSASNESADMVK
jgi:hypothetical protein